MQKFFHLSNSMTTCDGQATMAFAALNASCPPKRFPFGARVLAPAVAMPHEDRFSEHGELACGDCRSPDAYAAPVLSLALILCPTDAPTSSPVGTIGD